MKKHKKLAGFASLVLAACMLLTSCSGGASTSSAAGSKTGSAASASSQSGSGKVDLLANNKYKGTADADMITINLSQEPPEMNSMMCSDTASSNILRETMAGLTKLDENDQPEPDMATSWTKSDDGKTYTLKLRQDAKWSNGDPVTAHDFVFAWLTVMTKKTASPYSFIMLNYIKNGQEYYDGKVKADQVGVKAVDDYTLEVTFKTPLPYALQLFAFQTYLPVDEKAYKAIGADKYAKDADKIVTNGAYKITEWKHNDHVTITKNDDYWDKDKVGIPKIKYVELKDSNTAINAFKAGQLDYMTLGKDNLANMKAQGQPVAKYEADSNWYIEYNVKRKLFSSAKVRQALGMAIDTKSLCDNVLRDGSVPATGFVPSAISGANGKSYGEARGDIALKYNVEKAKQLLAEGLKEEGLTVSTFKPVFLTQDTTNAVRESTFMQEQWKTNLGIQVELKPMSFKSAIASQQTHDFDLTLAGWAPDYNDAMTFMDLHKTGNGNNNADYSSKTYDDLIDKASAEADETKRQNYLIQAEKLMVQEDCPVFPIYFDVIDYTTSSKFSGVICTGFQGWPGNYINGAKLTASK